MRISLAITLILITLSIEIYSQELQFYYPDGKKYTGKAKSIGELNNELEERGRIYYHLFESNGDFTSVGFKLFTNKPIWVQTKDSTKIDSAILSFDLNKFFTYDFERELESNVKEKTLTKDFILETLGQPDRKIKIGENISNIENWTYTALGVRLKFDSESLVSYRKNTDSVFIDSIAIINKYKDCCNLKAKHYYWLSQNYCEFKDKDTTNEIMFSGKGLSKFQVLYQSGSYVFIKFKSVSTARSLRPDTLKINSWLGNEICNTAFVNVADTYAVNAKDFSVLYYEYIGDEARFDYLLKGTIKNITKSSIGPLPFILIIDEGFDNKDSLLLQTDKNGIYEFLGDTHTGFRCLTGVSKKNRKTYNERHKYISFTIIIDKKIFYKRIKRSEIYNDEPIQFDISFVE